MTLAAHIDALESRGLIRLAQSAPEREYIFQHTLLQETAYASLLKDARKRLHRAVGETLEQLYPEQLDELAPLLGQHFAEADGAERARHYLTRAGDHAARVYANAEAVAHYSRAIEIAKHGGAIRESSLQPLYLKRGRVLELRGAYDDALANYAELEALARTHGDRAMELAALMARATIHSTLTAQFDPALGEQLCHQSLALAHELADRKAEAKILWNLLLVNQFTGRPREAVEYGKQSLALARRFDLREQLAYTLNDISRAFMSTGQRERAFAALFEARELWKSLGNLPMLADNLSNTAEHYLLTGEYAQTIARAEEARQISQSIGNLWGQAYSGETAAYGYLERGEIAKAIQYFEESITLGAQAGFLDTEISARSFLAFVYAVMGDLSRAQDLLQLVSRRAQALKINYAPPLANAMLARLDVLKGALAPAEAKIAASYRALEHEVAGSPAPYFVMLADGELALAQQDYARAIALMDKLVAEMDDIGAHLFVPDMLYLKSRALLAQGRLDDARDALRQARAEKGNSPLSQWQILAALGDIEARRGNPAEAQALRAQAREIVEYLADHTPQELSISFLNLPAVRAVIDSDIRSA